MASKPKKCEITRWVKFRWWFNRNFKVITIVMLAVAVVLLAAAILLAISPYSWSGEMTRGFFLGSYFHRAEEVRMGADEVDEVVVVVPSPEVVIPDDSVPAPAPKPTTAPQIDEKNAMNHKEMTEFLRLPFPIAWPRGAYSDNFILPTEEAVLDFLKQDDTDKRSLGLNEACDLLVARSNQGSRAYWPVGNIIDPTGKYVTSGAGREVIVVVGSKTDPYVIGIDPLTDRVHRFPLLDKETIEYLDSLWKGEGTIRATVEVS